MENKDRFSFMIDRECIEIYEEGTHFMVDSMTFTHNILCILTIDQALQLKKTLNEAFVEWKKINKKPLDYKKSPEKCPLKP